MERGDQEACDQEAAEEPLSLERATERLLEDERLRAELDDDEAQALLDWAIARLEAAAATGAALESVVQGVRQAAGEINDLVALRAELRDASLDQRFSLWQRLDTRLRALAGRPPASPFGLLRGWLPGGDSVATRVHRALTSDGAAFVRAALDLLPPAPTEAT